MNPPHFQKLLNRPQNLLSGWIAFSVLAAIVAGVSIGLSVSLLVLAGGALLLVIALFWWSLHSLTGTGALTLEEAMSMAAPSAEEEQKRAVLRALKDLELEKSLGKISDEDYKSLSASYRQQAKDLIRALDANLEPLRAEIDELVAQRLKERPDGAPLPKKKAKRRAPAVPADLPSDTPSVPEQATPVARAEGEPARAVGAAGDDEDEDAASPAPAPAASGRQCSACQAQNDVDARFCKRCGVVLEASS